MHCRLVVLVSMALLAVATAQGNAAQWCDGNPRLEGGLCQQWDGLDSSFKVILHLKGPALDMEALCSGIQADPRSQEYALECGQRHLDTIHAYFAERRNLVIGLFSTAVLYDTAPGSQRRLDSTDFDSGEVYYCVTTKSAVHTLLADTLVLSITLWPLDSGMDVRSRQNHRARATTQPGAVATQCDLAGRAISRTAEVTTGRVVAMAKRGAVVLRR